MKSRRGCPSDRSGYGGGGRRRLGPRLQNDAEQLEVAVAVPFDHATAMAEAIVGSVLVRWEGVGHEMPPALMPDLAHAIVAHTAATATWIDGN
jgi:hypothetical protein